MKLPFLFFLCPGKVAFPINNCISKWGGNQCDWGVRNPSWQQQTGHTNRGKQIPERGRGICIRVLTFLTYTQNGSYDRALKNLGLYFIFAFLSVWLWITQTACWNWATVSLRFFSSSVLQVSFMLTVLLHHLCSIFVLLLEAKWYN